MWVVGHRNKHINTACSLYESTSFGSAHERHTFHLSKMHPDRKLVQKCTVDNQSKEIHTIRLYAMYAKRSTLRSLHCYNVKKQTHESKPSNSYPEPIRSLSKPLQLRHTYAQGILGSQVVVATTPSSLLFVHACVLQVHSSSSDSIRLATLHPPLLFFLHLANRTMRWR